VIDLRSWPKRWNDTGLRDIAILPENSPSRPWSLLGMLAVGLVAGAALGYALSQRSRTKPVMYGHSMDDEVEAMGSDEAGEPGAEHRSTRSNHGRKATSEV
jgi:hypothetical protein